MYAAVEARRKEDQRSTAYTTKETQFQWPCRMSSHLAGVAYISKYNEALGCSRGCVVLDCHLFVYVVEGNR